MRLPNTAAQRRADRDELQAQLLGTEEDAWLDFVEDSLRDEEDSLEVLIFIGLASQEA